MTERDLAAQHALLAGVADSVEKRFQAARRVLSFAEYLDLFATDPECHSRDASRYLRDVFDHYGSHEVERPWGRFTRWNLFDLPWEAEGDRKGALVGQELVQGEIHRAIANFAREGRPNRLILLHGPNGSAKSTIVSCIIRALENYSTLPTGALYRFNWVFPSSKTVKGALGFGEGRGGESRNATALTSYAHLPDDQIDAKLLVEVRDHPLFLLPTDDRRALIGRLSGSKTDGRGVDGDGKTDKPREADRDERPNDWILRGQLSHKSQQVFEALLASYDGSYLEVLKHVQVERYFISQRYRTGAVTIGPQMHVDAGERQITADRTLSALPASLQAITLYEAKGELVEAAGGVLEFSDLLKRPLDTFKYLQLSIETGEVALTQQNVQLNCVMMGSANELHLDAFREHPEFASFRGRLELLRVPYLRSYLEEKKIYDEQVAGQVRRHVAPHATEVAAMFSVLTRMRKVASDKYPRPLAAASATLTAVEKMELYATGIAPERLDADAQKVLQANVGEIFSESDSYPIYEGRIGASPREMRIVLLDAAQSQIYKCLNPLAVLDEIEQLSERKSEFEWLQQDAVAGGYHDVKQFKDALNTRLLTAWEDEFYASSGLVEEQRYAELFERYVQHVSVWTKKERIRNKLTGEYEEPDEKMMREVERLLGVQGDPDEPRRQMISAIAAWAIDHSGQRVEGGVVFPAMIKKMRDAIFGDRRPQVAALTRDLVLLVRDEGAGLDLNRKKAAEGLLSGLSSRFGYCRNCAADAASVLIRKRFHELLV